ncbi:hypothetical protein GCM10010520_20220 [Rhizobium viscosum]|uniref:Helix-turn-helix domain-containing protein n=1 Tax=Rhizobium viscosum TaxID=1673 RepID=A0ABR9J2I9_RHIVS|nr:hypothetical protein [Rhizobium viscosum]
MGRSFVQLSMDERRVIARMHEKKISQARSRALFVVTARRSTGSCVGTTGTIAKFLSLKATGM